MVVIASKAKRSGASEVYCSVASLLAMTDCPGGFCLRHNLGAAVRIDALDQHNEDVGVSYGCISFRE